MLVSSQRWIVSVAFLFVFSITYVLFCLYFVSLEDPVYVWDFGEFWRMYQRLGAAFGGFGWVREIAQSIYAMDYNISGAVPLMPTYLLLGGGRAAYVATIAVLYGIPACILMACLANRTAHVRDRFSQFAVLVVALSSIPLLAPTLRGMWDIIGLIPLAVATIVILDTGYLAKARFRQLLFVGLALWAAFLFRRWYAYSVVGLMAVALIFAIIANRRTLIEAKVFFRLVLNFAVVTGVFCILALTMQYGLVSRIIATDYGDIYAAYYQSPAANLSVATQRVGVVGCGLIMLGVFCAAWKKAHEVLFCAAVAIVVYVLFTKTQLMGVHHFMPVAFWLFPPLIFGVKSIGAIFRLRDRYLMSVYAIYAVVLLVGSTVAPRWLPDNLYPLENRPLLLDNREGYDELLTAIRQNRTDREKINTFGSSLVLSSELLKSLAPDVSAHVTTVPHLASVQPFRFEPMRAKYQVASIPAMTHLAPGTQRHLQVPNDLIVEGKDFGSGFTKIGGPYRLSAGVDAFLYKKNRPLNADDIERLLPVLYEVNPAWREQFRNSMEARFALREEVLGDVWGNIGPIGDNWLSVHPGATSETSLTVPLKLLDSAPPKSVSFSIPADALKSCPNADGVSIVLSVDGKVIWKEPVLPGKVKAASIPAGDILALSIANNGTPYCDTVTVQFSM
ncbi:hypothetical protein J2T09_003027 [Neorhizobium huautlense]|uniref:Uncharacterized protein n=1 Tax=Neorhizobium huautlense TaxID=67774 RepID=A0ABT9PUV4_9HYPH|nr:hypothetical protein [Neorhizobium huautlense]MDP9838260.1 hypothetical protein [Neorhizobium huautlense]